MPENFNPSRPIDFHHDRFTQISESHCGPAVIEMLLFNLGIEVTQEAVADAGGAGALIEQQGMRIDQLMQAVQQLAPQTRFWYRDHSEIKQMAQIVNEYNYPVGIEWQGIFEDTLDDETQDSDYGHYSVVTLVDDKNRNLVIVDPYKDFRSQDRIFTIEFFMSRWWDLNNVSDPLTGKDHQVEDRQMMFIITPEEATFPRLLGMQGD